MPIFDYKCPECGETVETEIIPEAVTCKCGEKMKRVWSVPVIHAGCLNKGNLPK